AIDDVQDLAVVVVNDIDNLQAALKGPPYIQETDIEGLAAGGGIKTCAIEHDDGAAVPAIDANDRRVKLAKIRVRVVQPFRHLPFSRRRSRRRRATRRRTSRRPTRC